MHIPDMTFTHQFEGPAAKLTESNASHTIKELIPSIKLIPQVK
jgi:hypothetical protein